MAARREQLRPRRTQTDVAAICRVTLRQVKRWEAGTSHPYRRQHAAIAEAYDWPLDRIDELLALDPEPTAEAGSVALVGDHVSARAWTTVQVPDLHGLEAVELVRRIEASDLGPATLDAISDGVDRLCRSYTSTPPADLLAPLTAYQRYVGTLLDARATLRQRRELMVHGGWLSLLAATCYIDLHQQHAAAVNLDAARSIATELGHGSLAGWVAETEAWQAVTAGRYDDAVTACEAGLRVAPPDTSAFVQLCMQQARATARLGLASETHRLLDACAGALDRMPPPEHPEHHYVFDPRRLVAYSAGALVYLGDDDGVAEEYARRAVAQYDVGATDGRWVRRLALARIDLALVLARAGEPAEAVALGHQALSSGRVAASDMYTADDLDRTLTERYPDSTDVRDFHGRYIDVRHELERPRELPPGP